eukprot:gene4347-14751_t
MGETLIGIKFNDYTVMAASGQGMFYFLRLSDNEDKLHELDQFKICGAVGEQGDRTAFTSECRAHLALESLTQNGK